MNVVGKHLQEQGFEFLAVNSELKKNPQFVCLKDKIMHFVVVRLLPIGFDPSAYDRTLMAKVRRHAERFEARTYFAGVGLESKEGPERPLVKGRPYLMEFNGLLEWEH